MTKQFLICFTPRTKDWNAPSSFGKSPRTHATMGDPFVKSSPNSFSKASLSPASPIALFSTFL
eukprot:7002296-Pyramimonas_sp.AAC.2